ncbi:predicted protein [Chaetoceros tenuissimus]|uniref:Uncharacterized protein n=1 Tax=Chaetoceros tenuissimus TaxID=426638 RepID=A0AAD3CE75_9STRA|nr:predicted protein [Chaetoceros tenuissimus]
MEDITTSNSIHILSTDQQKDCFCTDDGWSHVFTFLGKGHYLLLALVSKRFAKLYAKLYQKITYGDISGHCLTYAKFFSSEWRMWLPFQQTELIMRSIIMNKEHIQSLEDRVSLSTYAPAACDALMIKDLIEYGVEFTATSLLFTLRGRDSLETFTHLLDVVNLHDVEEIKMDSIFVYALVHQKYIGVQKLRPKRSGKSRLSIRHKTSSSEFRSKLQLQQLTHSNSCFLSLQYYPI